MVESRSLWIHPLFDYKEKLEKWQKQRLERGMNERSDGKKDSYVNGNYIFVFVSKRERRDIERDALKTIYIN